MNERGHLRLVHSKPMNVERWKRGAWEKRDVPGSSHLKAVRPAAPPIPKRKSPWARRLLAAGIAVSITAVCAFTMDSGILGGREGKAARESREFGRRNLEEIGQLSNEIGEASEEIRRAKEELKESNADFAEYSKQQNREFSEYVEGKNREMRGLNRRIKETRKSFEADIKEINAVNRRLDMSLRGLGRESKKLDGSAGRVLKKTKKIQGQQGKILRHLRRMEKQRRDAKKAQ